MSFEETVKYIKEKVEEKNGESQCDYGTRKFYNSSKQYEISVIKKLEIKSNGECEIPSTNIYISGIKFNIQKCLTVELDQDDKTMLKFYVTDDSFYYIQPKTQIDSERLSKAFNHLKSILPKEKDPFDN